MTWKRWLATGVLAAGWGFGSLPARGEEPAPPPPPKSDAPAAAKKETPKEPPKKKDPFFGDHFAMYLEVRGGPGSVDTIRNGVGTTAQFFSDNELKFTGNKVGQFTVGWTLPRGRGQYILTYSGVADGEYELDASGEQTSYVTQATALALTIPQRWWTVHVQHGQLSSIENPPIWNPANDTNGNGFPDPDEFQYGTPTADVQGVVPKDLGNRVQTWDLAYRREFGGVRIRSQWSAGIRFLKYNGALVTPSWLVGVQGDPTFGYSDGIVNPFLLMQQSTKGFGPEGTGEVQFNFFRQRLVLYTGVQAAFLDVKLHADSGPFVYFAHDVSTSGGGPVTLPGQGHIEREVSKTAWNLAFELGVRIKLLEGFHMLVAWNHTGYLDTLLVPTVITIPQNNAQISLGTTALFTSRDFNVSSYNLGLSFQF